MERLPISGHWKNLITTLQNVEISGHILGAILYQQNISSRCFIFTKIVIKIVWWGIENTIANHNY